MRYTHYDLLQTAYIPGETARPTKEPLEEEGVTPVSLSAVSPHENSFFLFAVDLFNHHYFWEAHEAWETIWHLEKAPELRNLIQGLIQLSGSYLKIIQGNERGTRTLWKKCYPRLSRELLEETGVKAEQFLQNIETDDGVRPLELEKLFSFITLSHISPLL